MDFTPGELMRIHRTRKDMTQEALAEKIGSYQVRVSRLENEIEIPTSEEIEKIEDALEVNIWTQQRGGAMNGA
ncbi:XRE family transcriptional regulator [Paenibacillus oralis]|uniref:XRE family transcriptional regulator n=1 Tax=Paenibacillus oralis TaxID=2490856 RepID=A0A3P3TA06_9BACL|nr:helix-turn-helix transcriptional regulator [Paenibacillus oralis]RRJ54895.1 XRE family transcriptional regulator [Paenibacillus oralis]